MAAAAFSPTTRSRHHSIKRSVERGDLLPVGRAGGRGLAMQRGDGGLHLVRARAAHRERVVERR